MCGNLIEVLYDEKGNEKERVHLNPTVDKFGCVVPAGVWHTVEVLEPSIIYEAKMCIRDRYRTWGNTMTSIPVLYLKSLPYLIKHRKEIDMVMYQTVTFSVIPSLIVRLFGMKSSAIIHSLAEDSPKHGKMMKKLLMASMRLALAFTKNVVTVSCTKAKEVYNRYHKSCKVLPCGVFLPKMCIRDRCYLFSGECVTTFCC